MKKVALTGDRPTGRLHLGHYAGSLVNRVRLQDEYKQYVMVADIQALTDNFANPHKIRENVVEVVKDYLSVGIDPYKSTIFLQSYVSEITELTVYLMNMVNLGRLERNPTVKAEIQQKGFGDSIPVGFLCYPISQAADITAFKAEVVPGGEDQIPLIEQTNEIVRHFQRIYDSDCLKETQIILSNTPRLVGIDGKAKASKSLNNAIFLSDSPEEIKRKVFMMYTDPGHLRVSDPGKVEGNVVFTYLDVFHGGKEELDELKKHYMRGGLGDVTIKNLLNDILQQLLSPIRDIRDSLMDDKVRDIVHCGSRAAKETAAQTLAEVRDAMGLGYFSQI